MPLIVKLAASGGKEIALLKTESVERPAEQTPLGKVILDFELTPLSLTSTEDRQRVLAALVQLKEESGVEESLAYLMIPQSWGVAQRLPNPSLPENQLREHLQWELSMALLDSVDQYQYNYAFDDGSVLLTALRSRLFNLLKELTEDAGFQLQGLSFEGDPWQLVDLTGTTAKMIELPRPKPQAKNSPVEPEMEKKPAYRRPTASQPKRFFTILVVLAVAALAVFAYWKLTTKRPSTRPVMHTETAPAVPARPDTAAMRAEEARRMAPEAAWTVMSQRMALMQQILDVTSKRCTDNLVCFTANRFISQISAQNFDDVNDCVNQIKDFPVLVDVKSRLTLPENGITRGVVCGIITAGTPGAAISRVDSSAILAMAKNRGLKRKRMIFSGGEAEVIDFLADVSGGGYSVYRVILVPWGDDGYRVSLEF